MGANYNFSLGFAQGTGSKAKTPDRLLKRQPLQEICTGMSLVSLCLGFPVFGMLIIVSRHQADPNGLSGDSFVAAAGGICAFLVGMAFLVAACLHWRFCARRSAAPSDRRQSGLSANTIPVAAERSLGRLQTDRIALSPSRMPE
jgi:hypothetical protein